MSDFVREQPHARTTVRTQLTWSEKDVLVHCEGPCVDLPGQVASRNIGVDSHIVEANTESGLEEFAGMSRQEGATDAHLAEDIGSESVAR